jgi:hypothetical protein
MNGADYLKLQAVSASWLKDLLDSPATCYQKHLAPEREPETQTPEMRMGSLVHCMALTPLELPKEFIVNTQEQRSAAGKARAARLAAHGKTVVTTREFARASEIVAALKAHPEAWTLLRDGRPEQVIIQERGADWLPLKARLDVHDERRRRVVELKTIHDLLAIEGTIRQFHYLLGAAFYRELADAREAVFVFVQSTPPFPVEVIPVHPEDLERGRAQWQSALARFDECWKTQQWPDAEPDATDDLAMDLWGMTAAGEDRLRSFSSRSQNRSDLPVGELEL